MVVHFITGATNANVYRGSRGERFAGSRCRGTTKVSDEPWNPRGKHTEAGRAMPGLSCIRKTRRVTQFRLRRANAGPGDDDGAGPGWTLARGGSLRTWNGACWMAFSRTCASARSGLDLTDGRQAIASARGRRNLAERREPAIRNFPRGLARSPESRRSGVRRPWNSPCGKPC